MRRPLTSALVVAVLAAALLGARAVPVGARAQAPKPTAAVGLGDSFASGEGGRWAGNSTGLFSPHDNTDRAASLGLSNVYIPPSYSNGCNRSDVAPILSAALPVDQTFNLACSGATTKALLPAARGGETFRGEAPQIERLGEIARSHDVEVVTVSIGGNDLGFGEIIAKCAAAWTLSTWLKRFDCRFAEQRVVDKRMDDLRRAVSKTLDALHDEMRKAGYRRSDYRVLLVGYPSPIPRGSENRYGETGLTRLTTGGCPFWNSDSDWARDALLPQLDDALDSLAHKADVQYLDLRDLLQGHEVCATAATLVSGSPNPATAEWARWLNSGLLQGHLEESMHPNAYGQQAMGLCISRALTWPEDTDVVCSGAAGITPNDVTAAPAPKKPKA